MNQTLFFSVGEPSGDQHAARLIEALRAERPEVQVRGFGGPAMRQAGCRLDLDLTEHAVVGLVEVLPKLRDFFRFADQAEALFASGQVDAVVLVDFPGFNWHIAKRAKKYGLPVYYYCPPQLWAWGGWRVRKMRATVDHVLTVLPIETQYFGQHGIPTSFVGHPFFDAVAESRLDAERLRRLAERSAGEHTVAVLPGSRSGEVRQNWPIFQAAIEQLAPRFPHVRFAVAGYRESQLAFCREHSRQAGAELPIDFYQGATSEIIEHAGSAMMVSGSVSLELMARGTPAAVLYRVGWLLYAVGRCVVNVDSVTLPNLMPAAEDGAERPAPAERVFPEMISVGKPQRARDFLVQSVGKLLADEGYRQGKCEHLASLSAQYARPGASARAARRVLELLEAASRHTAADSQRRAA